MYNPIINPEEVYFLVTRVLYECTPFWYVNLCLCHTDWINISWAHSAFSRVVILALANRKYRILALAQPEIILSIIWVHEFYPNYPAQFNFIH